MTFSRLSAPVTAVLSLLVALVSVRFLGLGFDTAFPPFAEHLAARRWAFVLHVVASPVALAAGAVQFFPKLRAKRPALHRWTGRVYALAVLVGGVSALALAPFAPGGWVAGAGFFVLGLLWLGFTAQALRLAMARRLAEHRVWMFRSFALTFAAVTLRIYLPFFGLGGMDYVAASVWVAWISWVPNLLVVEVWLRRRA